MANESAATQTAVTGMCHLCNGWGRFPDGSTCFRPGAMTYGQAELARLRAEPVTCWRCGEEIPDDPDLENCPHCGADLVPF